MVHESKTRTLMISTCGTSLLTHHKFKPPSELLNDKTNLTAKELEAEPGVKQTIDQLIKARRDSLEFASFEQVRKMSAELNGVLGYYAGQLERASRDHHILLHTDTYQGEQTALVLADWLRDRHVNAMTQCAEHLTTSSVEQFHHGINSIIAWCADTIPGYANQGYHVVFNLVAGFKGLHGFMQTLGMFYAHELLYIFESSDQLLRIPRLPVQFEPAIREVIQQHLEVFRWLDSVRHTIDADRCAGIPETLIATIDGLAELSPWGRLAWNRYKREFYEGEILPPLSDRVMLSPKAKGVADKLSADRKFHVNERIDDLVRYVESNQQECPRRLTFKKLQGKPAPPATHEFYLWSDQAAWRGLGYFQEERFLIDDIREHL